MDLVWKFGTDVGLVLPGLNLGPITVWVERSFHEVLRLLELIELGEPFSEPYPEQYPVEQVARALPEDNESIVWTRSVVFGSGRSFTAK